MPVPNLFPREIGSVQKGNIHDFTDNAINRVCCKREDEHYIEAKLFGEVTPPLACSFSKTQNHILAVVDEDGGILILNTKRKGLHAISQDWHCHKNAIFDVDWMPGEHQLVTASGDKTVALWDVEKEEKTCSFRGHTSSVKTVRFLPGSSAIFATGARDGQVMIWDKRVKEKDGVKPAVNIIRNAHKLTQSSTSKKRRTQQDGPQSVTAVLFQDDNTIITTGSTDRAIKVWDIRKTYSVMKSDAMPKHTFQYSGSSMRMHGFSSLLLDTSRTRLFASCIDNTIYQYDAAALSKDPVACFRGHKNSTFFIKTCLSPDEEYLLSGSSDNNAYIWRVSRPQSSPWKVMGHTNEVSAVQWCPSDIGQLVTISDDSTLRIWRIRDNPEKPLQAGELIGTIQRTHREVGVSTRHSSDPSSHDTKKPPLLSPRKGAVVAPSPAKLSGIMHTSIASLSKSASKTISNDKPSTSESLASPSITKWFGKKQPSPSRKTPKKLFVTPKKQDIACPPLVPGLSGKENDHSRSVKRKLYEGSVSSPEPEKSSKRPRRGDLEFFQGHIQDENSCDRDLSCKKTPTSSPGCEARVLQPKVQQNSGQGALEALGSSGLDPEKGTVTPLKTEASFSRYQSPTMNLPNYVADPQPRAPVGTLPTTPRTPDWLTQIRLQRRHGEGASPRASLSIDTPKAAQRRTPAGKKIRPQLLKGEDASSEASASSVTPKSAPRRTPAGKQVRSKEEAASSPQTKPDVRASGVTPRRTPQARSKAVSGKKTEPQQSEADDQPEKRQSTPSEKQNSIKTRGSIMKYFSPHAGDKSQRRLDGSS